MLLPLWSEQGYNLGICILFNKQLLVNQPIHVPSIPSKLPISIAPGANNLLLRIDKGGKGTGGTENCKKLYSEKL